MPNPLSEFRSGLVPARPLIMEVLGVGRGAAYKMLQEFETEFKRQRGICLPRSGSSNTVFIDRERFDILRTIRKDYTSGIFASYRDAVRYHLNPERPLTAVLESIAADLDEALAEIAKLHTLVAETYGRVAGIASMVEQVLSELRELHADPPSPAHAPTLPKD